MKSQRKEILAHLQKRGSLTGIDALMMFDCWRLGARIFELREEGHNIKTKIVQTKSGKRIAKYSYENN